MEATTKTNNVPPDIIDARELSAAERADFDYLDWPAIEAGEDSASFFRHQGHLYDLGAFMTTSGMPSDNPLSAWNGCQSNAYSSAVVVRYAEDRERVIVGFLMC